MRASVGDKLIILGRYVARPVRTGVITEVGPDGEPPYRVRWSDDGRETLLFPGPDAQIVGADEKELARR